MKKILTLIIFILLIFALNITIFAEENDYYSQSIDEILDETNEETKSLLEKLGLNEFTAEKLGSISFKDITELLIGIFKGSLAEPIAPSLESLSLFPATPFSNVQMVVMNV